MVLAGVDVTDGPGARDALKEINTCIFDCDGVLWRGSRKIQGCDEVIASLEASGKRVFYLTNNSAKSRDQCAQKLAHFGISARKEQIICSSSSAASYLDSIDFDKRGRVLVIGQEGILIELKEAGYETVRCDDVAGSSDPRCPIPDYEALEVDASIRAVVAGVDDSFTYRKLCVASLYLQKDPERVFVATNLDVGDSVGADGRLIPGAGPVIASIESASGREAVNVGKGGEWLLPFLLDKFQLDSSRTCIVGDRLDTGNGPSSIFSLSFLVLSFYFVLTIIVTTIIFFFFSHAD